VPDTGKLELARPDCFRRVVDQALGEVALDAADHVVVLGVPALGDDAEGVVFHDGGAADAAEEALLHAPVEAEDCYFWGGLCGC